MGRGSGDSKLTVSFGSRALFKWKGKSCSDSEASSCCIGHGDILVMGHCEDEFLHCTNPGLERERIDVSFRWMKRHTASCTLRTGVVCCLPTCAQGSSAAVTRWVGDGIFGHAGVSLGSRVFGGVLALLSFSPHVYRTRVTEVCLSLDTPVGRRSAGASSA